jgi:hypothetical protein
MGIQRRRTRHHDEPRYHHGKHAPKDHINARCAVLAFRHAFFNNRSLQVKLHPRRNGRSYQAYHHVEVCILFEFMKRRRLDA